MNTTGGQVDTNIVAIITFIVVVLFLWGIGWILYRIASAFVKWISRLVHHKDEVDTGTAKVKTLEETQATAIPRQQDKVVSQEFHHTMEIQHPKIVTDIIPFEGKIVKYHYKKKKYIMTKSEQEFHRRLFRIFGREYLIYPQIHLSTLFTPDDPMAYIRRAALSMIQRKSVDYVLCTTDLQPVCAIELDDISHILSERAKRDAFVNALFNEMNMPLVRISTDDMLTNDEIYHQVMRAINSAV